LELTGDSVEVRHDCGCGGVCRRVRAGGRECCGMSGSGVAKPNLVGARVGWLAGWCVARQRPKPKANQPQRDRKLEVQFTSTRDCPLAREPSHPSFPSRLSISISISVHDSLFSSLIPSRTYQAAAASRLPSNTQRIPIIRQHLPDTRQHGGQKVRARPLARRR
jgi:hypothetical protein